jgi:hypothetical protein
MPMALWSRPWPWDLVNKLDARKNTKRIKAPLPAREVELLARHARQRSKGAFGAKGGTRTPRFYPPDPKLSRLAGHEERSDGSPLAKS